MSKIHINMLKNYFNQLRNCNEAERASMYVDFISGYVYCLYNSNAINYDTLIKITNRASDIYVNAA